MVSNRFVIQNLVSLGSRESLSAPVANPDLVKIFGRPSLQIRSSMLCLLVPWFLK